MCIELNANTYIGESTIFRLFNKLAIINPRTYKQSHTPIVIQGGFMEAFPWIFAVFKYFGEILPLLESL